MAIVVLVLWLFTAGAGFSVLITSNLKGGHAVSAAQLVPAEARTAEARAAGPVPVSAAPVKDRFAPPSLVAARNAPVVPGRRALLEFAHPALGIIGLAFWLGFSLVHYRVLGWIGFGLAAATACAGLTWFTINVRAAKRHEPKNRENRDSEEPPPSFRGRLVALHGAGAALSFVLAALSAVVLRG